jgi:hypothetical protein
LSMALMSVKSWLGVHLNSSSSVVLPSFLMRTWANSWQCAYRWLVSSFSYPHSLQLGLSKVVGLVRWLWYHCFVSLKIPYTLVGFEPGSSHFWGRCDVQCATPTGHAYVPIHTSV